MARKYKRSRKSTRNAHQIARALRVLADRLDMLDPGYRLPCLEAIQERSWNEQDFESMQWTDPDVKVSTAYVLTLESTGFDWVIERLHETWQLPPATKPEPPEKRDDQFI